MEKTSYNKRLSKHGLTMKQIHRLMRKTMSKPDRCDKCGTVCNVDLANKSNEYMHEKEDWEWLCRKCHMASDGRLDKFLASSNMHNKLSSKKCQTCGSLFSPHSLKSKYCSTSCRTTYTNLNFKKYSNR